MIYEIEIWQYHTMVQNYKSNNIEEVLEWFRDEGWSSCYDDGGCAFYVYKSGIELSFEELHDLGFIII